MPAVDVIVPVYRNLEATRRCIESVLAAPCRTPYELIVINDATQEPDLARFLRELKDRGHATLVEQPVHQGYAAAVNRAIALHRDRDVVVLQSDAEVANDWLDRLVAHGAARGIGVIGTFTNNAGSATYPLARCDNLLPEGMTVAKLDALFARANPGSSATLPALEGPCLYFRRDCLEKVGAFDAAPLGSDFGVEVDFCLRAGSAGFRNVVAGDVFIGHAGHVTFGAREADDLAGRTELALRKLYPAYANQKADTLLRDPGRAFARRVDLLRLAEAPDRPLLF
ncbi:MAG: glycosyltransferase, partial [Betaproteobacteria bacterium]